MKSAIIAVTFAVLGLGLAPPAAAGKVFPYKYDKEVLPNGLTVITVPMDTPGLVAYWSVVRTGSRDEVEPGRTGFAHFFEHMMFRGTKRFPGPVYNEIVTGLGADANAFTTDDLTAYHLQFAKEDLEKVIEIESDRFQNLSYEKADFQTEAGAIYGEYRKSVTSPFFLLDEKLRERAYDLHTYKHTTMGFEADIKAMPEAYQYSISFFERFYRPENVVLLIVGDIEPQKTLSLVKKYYGDWKPGYVPPKVVQEPPQAAERTVEISYPGQTLPILDIAYKGEALNPQSRDFAAGLLIGDLAFGPTSPLYKKLVIHEQKVEFLAAQFAINRDMPLWEIVTMVRNAEDIPYVRDAILQTSEQFKASPVDAKRLEDVKRHNKYSFLMDLNSPDNVAQSLSRLIALTGGIEVVDHLYNQMDQVTPDDIQHAARKYFDPKRRTTAILKGTQP